MVLATFSTLALGALLAYTVDSRHDFLTLKEQRKGSGSDGEITRAIEEAIKTDANLAASAQNIKIITLKNTVTLEGHVNSKLQKFKAAHLARTIAGERTVYNKLIY